MEAILKYLPLLALIVGVWGVGNGILHDIFVVNNIRAYTTATFCAC